MKFWKCKTIFVIFVPGKGNKLQNELYVCTRSFDFFKFWRYGPGAKKRTHEHLYVHLYVLSNLYERLYVLQNWYERLHLR